MNVQFRCAGAARAQNKARTGTYPKSCHSIPTTFPNHVQNIPESCPKDAQCMSNFCPYYIQRVPKTFLNHTQANAHAKAVPKTCLKHVRIMPGRNSKQLHIMPKAQSKSGPNDARIIYKNISHTLPKYTLNKGR